MYFKTCFVPIFDRFVRVHRVLQENLKKLGNHTFLDNSILALQLSHFSKNIYFQVSVLLYKLISIKFAVQRYIFRLYLMIPIFFPIGAPAKNTSVWICLIF